MLQTNQPMANMLSPCRKFINRAIRAVHILRNDGLWLLLEKVLELISNRANALNSYESWVARFYALTETAREQIKDDIAQWQSAPLISILMVIGSSDLKFFQAAKRSLEAQLYRNWELCVVYDAKTAVDIEIKLQAHQCLDQRIVSASVEEQMTPAEKFNRAFALSSGSFIAVLAAHDELSEQAFYWVVKEAINDPFINLIFTDEDQIDSNHRHCEPWFKTDWNLALMLSQNAFGFGLFRRDLVEQIGGFQSATDEDICYDLALRCAAKIAASQILHIPRILYHRRSDKSLEGVYPRPSDTNSGVSVVEQHLQRIGLNGSATAKGPHCYQVEYETPSPQPAVSIVIPTTGDARLLEPCLRSLIAKTTYDNFEILLLINEAELNSAEGGGLLRQFSALPCVRLLVYPDRPFNYSWVNNWAATQVATDLLCFLNDDTELITPSWLERLVARALLPGVGAVGPMLYYPDETIQQAGVILGLGGVAGHAFSGLPRGAGGYRNRAAVEQDVSCVTAACMMIRTSVFRDVGGFDEQFVIAYNDVDLCIRVRAAGWRIIWTPTVELYHHESASTGRHDSADRVNEFAHSVRLMRERWGKVLDCDPCYNPNLSLKRQFDLAVPPRHMFG